MSKGFSFSAIVAVCALAAACASEEKPRTEVAIEQDHYQPIHISAARTIGSDDKNANYDDNQTTVKVAKVPVMPELKEEKAAPLVSEPKRTRKPIPIVRQRQAPSVSYQAANILFADGSATVDAKYNRDIAKVAAEAKKHNAVVRIFGFASSRTKDTDIITHKNINFKMSLKRAESVAQALRRAGVKKENIVMEALSDSYPLYSEAMPEGERLNRRAEVYLNY